MFFGFSYEVYSWGFVDFLCCLAGNFVGFFSGFCATVWVLTAAMWGEREKQMGQDREERFERE